MIRRIVAFSGRAGSGKTTAANFLHDQHAATKISFASPVKELARQVFKLRPQQVYGTQVDKETPCPTNGGRTPREMLQTLGAAAREIIDQDVWLNAALNSIARGPAGLYTIDDARYPNEIRAIAERGGHVIKLICPDAPPVGNPDHPSETGPDDVDQSFFSATIECSRGDGAAELRKRVAHVLYSLGYSHEPPIV